MARDRARAFAPFVVFVLLFAATSTSVPMFEDMRMVQSDFPSVHAEKLIRQLNLFPKEELNVISGRDAVGAGGNGKRIVEKKFVFPNLVRGDSGVSVEDLGHRAGYYKLKHSHDARVFYFFFESRSNKDDPVVIWLTGGPGCSSELAVFFENGPFSIADNMSLVWNEYGWDKASNLIYIDQPVGTGFSYTSDKRDIRHNEKGVSDDLYDFLQAFFEEHPEFVKNDFFITGESYAGHYIPAFASRVHRGNKAEEGIHINLKGFAIGNGLTDPAVQYKAYTDYALDMGIIKQSQYEKINKILPACETAIKLCGTDGTISCMASYFVCNTIFSNIMALAGDTNISQQGSSSLCRTLPTKGDRGRSTSPASATTSSQTLNQLLLPAPPSSSGPSPPAKMDPKIDLLSGDDYSSPKAEPSLALVPMGGGQVATAASQQNALVLFNMFSDGNTQLNPINTQGCNPTAQSNPPSSQIQQLPSLQPPQFGVYTNGNSPTAGFTQPDPSFYAQGSGSVWNGQITQQQQQPSSPGYGAHTASSLPPPPWEAPATENSQGPGSPYAQPAKLPPVAVTIPQPVPTGMLPQSPYAMGNEQATGVYMPQVMNSQFMQPNQMMGLTKQAMQGGPFMGTMVPQQMQAVPMGYIYPQQMYGGQMAAVAYGYGPQGMQYADQRMYGLSVRDDSSVNNNSKSTPSYTPPMKPLKPEDKLFGDLLDIARAKKSAPM